MKPQCIKYKKCRWYKEDIGVITFNEKEEKPLYTCSMGQFPLTHNYSKLPRNKCPIKGLQPSK